MTFSLESIKYRIAITFETRIVNLQGKKIICYIWRIYFSLNIYLIYIFLKYISYIT